MAVEINTDGGGGGGNVVMGFTRGSSLVLVPTKFQAFMGKGLRKAQILELIAYEKPASFRQRV